MAPVTITYRGAPHTLLATTEGDGWVSDVWATPDGPALVVSAADWVPVFGVPGDDVAHPFIDVGGPAKFGYAVTPQPDRNPVERFHEAVKQGAERSAERLSASMAWEQAWP